MQYVWLCQGHDCGCVVNGSSAIWQLLECYCYDIYIHVYEYLSQTLTEPDLFKEAIQYVLPKSLLEPFYHFFYYFDVMNVSLKITQGQTQCDTYIRLKEP